jgi:hypothetical protein
MKRRGYLKRYSELTAKLRPLLIASVKQGNNRLAVKYLKRLNLVCKALRIRNIANGMPGLPYVDFTLERVKSDIALKGL